MNILLINYEFPPLGGGAANATQHLASSLAKKGHSITVLTTWFTGLPTTESLGGYTVARVKSLRKKKEGSNPIEMLSFCWHAIRWAMKTKNENKIDVAIAFFTIPSGLVAFTLKCVYKIPYIISLRGGDVPGFLPRELFLYHILTKQIIKFIWRNAHAVVANSVGLQKLAQQSISEKVVPIKVIPNGVDNNIYRPSDAQKESNTCKIIIAGRLRPQKRMDLVINALPPLVKNKFNIFLTIIGDGPLRPQLEKLVKSNRLEEHTTFMGWVNQARLAELYRDADIFVLPSLDEGMSNVILEAMASGLPIITTQIPGNLELIDENENGIFVDSVQELIAALARLIHDHDLRERMGNASYEKSKKFRWDDVAASYEKVLPSYDRQ